jgi:hypothetical protein
MSAQFMFVGVKRAPVVVEVRMIAPRLSIGSAWPTRKPWIAFAYYHPSVLGLPPYPRQPRWGEMQKAGLA